MKYSLTFHEDDFNRLTEHLFGDSTVEQAAYALCGIARTERETRLLVRQIIPVDKNDIAEQSPVHMKIKPPAYLHVIKQADLKKACFVFIHSHPTGLRQHSDQDTGEEEKLFKTAYVRISHELVHGSLIFPSPGNPIGRVWHSDGTYQPMEVIRVIGKRFKFFFHSPPAFSNPAFFDRQVRAFGEDIQALLGKLRVGIVGAGGTGSAVAEQLIRLGVGSLFIADGDRFVDSNINRVYGSRVCDSSIPKVKLLERLSADIGLGTSIEIDTRPITYQTTFGKLRECDIVFGCTDDNWGRSLLTRLAIIYYVPVFDMGVKINSQSGVIRSIAGRITTLVPGAACLFCRKRINPEQITAESMNLLNPEAAAGLRREGYAPELNAPDPAVISFTTAVASSAIGEFLHRLTGYLGSERESTEVLHLFDQTRLSTTNRPPDPDCFCMNKTNDWGRGDITPLMDTTWPPE